MKDYFLSKVKSMLVSSKLLFFLIFWPSRYATSFNGINEKFTTALDAFKFTTIICLFVLYVFNKIVEVPQYRDKVEFNATLVDIWLLIVFVCIFVSALIYIVYRKIKFVNQFTAGVLFSLSASFLIGLLIYTISVDYYNTINPQAFFGSGGSFEHFIHGMYYYLYPILLLFILIVYITCVNSYAVKKSGVMTFKLAFGIYWSGIIVSYITLAFIGDNIYEIIAKGLQVFLSVFG